ncbi:MAG: hypothetical protein ACI863_000588 [Flavobacteriales bacterium]|jgi:hypothetical protein|tara:strand:- start:454 stop:756 length:303 start_codon:yes stop_codon:yes gene_type:complete
MKNAKYIIGSILLIAGLTGIKLYKKHQRSQINAKQELIRQEQADRIFKLQKEKEVAKFEEEQQKRLDSINKVRKAKMDEGLELLKQAQEKINKEIEEENK